MPDITLLIKQAKALLLMYKVTNQKHYLLRAHDTMDLFWNIRKDSPEYYSTLMDLDKFINTNINNAGPLNATTTIEVNHA